jgi:carboxylate-amine ligase
MNSNKLFTIGVEEEFMICDSVSYDLINKAEDIMDYLDDNEKDRYSYELLLSEIEANTPICDDSNHAIREVIKNRLRLRNIGDDLGFKIGISGTHPTALPEEQKFVNNQSYNWVTNQLNEYARQNITFSTHIHIGLDNPETIIKVLNQANGWIAPFIALSANSPFFAGVQTGMESSRTFQFGIFPRTNILHHLDSYKEYENIREKLTLSNSIEKPRHLWWKIRPHFEYNTVEFRVCDIQRSLSNTKMFIAISQALVHTIYNDLKNNSSKFKGYNMEFLNDGIWKAATKGMKSTIINPHNEKIISMKDMVYVMLDYITPSLKHFGNEDAISIIDKIINGKTESEKQIDVYKKNGFDGLKKFLVESVEYNYN